MKVFVEKHVNENETITKTSKFIGLLMKTCILPIKVSDNKVLFEFFSKKMLIHFMGIIVFASCPFYGLIIYPTEFTQIYEQIFNQQMSWVEQLSFILSGSGSLVIFFLPFVLGYSFKNIDSDFLQYRNLKWPKIARLNIAGMNFKRKKFRVSNVQQKSLN